MKVVACAALFFGVFATVVSLGVAIHRPAPPQLNLYAKRSQLGDNGKAIRLQAWKSIRDLARRSGMRVVTETLTAQQIDSDIARLTYAVKFSRVDGTNVHVEYVLVTLNRSLWTVTQLAPGIDPAAAN